VNEEPVGPSPRYLLISSDCHAGPPEGHYREYLDPAFRGAYDEFNERMRSMRGGFVRDTEDRKQWVAEWAEKTGDFGFAAAGDARLRDDALDADGVAAEVIFPNADGAGLGGVDASPFGSGLGSSGRSDGEQVMAGARAHNRWLAELCAESRERRVGLACVPILHDQDAAIAEIEWAAEHGLRGVLIPVSWAPFPGYHDPCYDRVWSACVDHDLTVHVHSGGGGPQDVGPGPGSAAIMTTEAWFGPAHCLTVMLWGGVFERHPSLRFAVTEDGAWWVPDLIWRADDKYTGANHNVKKFGANLYREVLRMKPSEYFRRNVFIGASTPTPEEINRRERIGVDNLMWGNDFPHPEGTWPDTRDWVAIRFHDVPRAEARKILGENALRCYPQLDVPRMREIAERIGPTEHDVHEAPVPPSPDGADEPKSVADALT
jgi:predicted TIM-barrel fold metal-dependent hydrolase